MGLGVTQMDAIEQYRAHQAKPKANALSGMNGVAVFDDTGYYVKGGKFPKDNYSNAMGDGVGRCYVLHLRDKEARQKCLDQISQAATSNQELAMIAAENERLAIELAQKSLGGRMGAGSIALITIGSIAALTGMVILIKKYAK